MPTIAVTTESPIRKYSMLCPILMQGTNRIAFKYRLQEFPEPLAAPKDSASR